MAGFVSAEEAKAKSGSSQMRACPGKKIMKIRTVTFCPSDINDSDMTLLIQMLRFNHRSQMEPKIYVMCASGIQEKACQGQHTQLGKRNCVLLRLGKTSTTELHLQLVLFGGTFLPLHPAGLRSPYWVPIIKEVCRCWPLARLITA